MGEGVKDMRGVEIEVGDTVAYPGRQSSSIWLNVGVVTGFKGGFVVTDCGRTSIMERLVVVEKGKP